MGADERKRELESRKTSWREKKMMTNEEREDEGRGSVEDRHVTKRKEGISALSGNPEVYTMRQV